MKKYEILNPLIIFGIEFPRDEEGRSYTTDKGLIALGYSLRAIPSNDPFDDLDLFGDLTPEEGELWEQGLLYEEF